MEVFRAFDRLIKYCEELDHPKTWKMDVIARLNYFKQQSLCDLDRRHDEHMIKGHWEQLVRLVKGSSLFERGRLDHDIWPEITSFVGAVDPLYVPVPRYRPKEATVDFDKFEPRDFFDHLKSKGQPREMTVVEKTFSRLAVNYLLSVSRTPRMVRDQGEIKNAWRVAWPIWNKYGLLDEYRASKTLKSRILSFVDDRI